MYVNLFSFLGNKEIADILKQPFIKNFDGPEGFPSLKRPIAHYVYGGLSGRKLPEGSKKITIGYNDDDQLIFRFEGVEMYNDFHLEYKVDIHNLQNGNLHKVN